MGDYKEFCTVLFLCSFCGLVSADWLDGNDGVDRYGSDLPNMPLPLKNGSGPRDCAEMCENNPECNAWALAKPSCGGSTVSQPQCYLKAIVPQQVKNPCRVRYGGGADTSRHRTEEVASFRDTVSTTHNDLFHKMV